MAVYKYPQLVMHVISDHHTTQLWPKLPWSVAFGQQRYPISLVSEILSCLTITSITGDSASFVSLESQVYILICFINIFWLGFIREIRKQDWGYFKDNEVSIQAASVKQSLWLWVVFGISWPLCGGGSPELSCEERPWWISALRNQREMLCSPRLMLLVKPKFGTKKKKKYWTHWERRERISLTPKHSYLPLLPYRPQHVSG